MQEKYDDIYQAFSKRLKTIRTDILSADLFETVEVLGYDGAKVQLKTLASIIVERRSYIINIWNKSITNAVEKAIIEFDNSLNPQTDGNSIRINMPMMTNDRRIELAKLLDKILEEFRISIRTQRKVHRSEIDRMELSDDEKKQKMNILEKIIDKCSIQLKEATEKKKNEILNKS